MGSGQQLAMLSESRMDIQAETKFLLPGKDGVHVF